MSGQAQTKSLGMWWPNFDDEIESGTITNAIFSGETSAFINTSVNYHYATAYDIVNIEVPPFEYLLTSGLFYRFVVNYEFVKNLSYGTESYSNVYYTNSY
jgi:hypothetical protein